VNSGGIDVGPIGAWGGPRRNFYEYNWARSGATSSTLLSAGQHTGLAGQVGPDSIDYAVLMIGANDQFDGSNAYLNIYQGLWSPAQINNWVNGVVANIDTALSTVVPTGVKLALFNSPDYGVTPAVKSSATSAAGRQAVADVIANQLNPAIEALAVAHQVAYVDLGAALAEMFGPHTSPNSTLSIGNVNINLNSIDTSIGSNPTAGFVHDGVHPNTTLQGLIANLALEALNIGYGANLPLFTEQEILAHRGIAYGGSDTLASQIGDYSVYITSYVPEPSSCALAGLAAVALAVVARRRRKAA
jgi:MYXO-CTERM domain-containing protein